MTELGDTCASSYFLSPPIALSCSADVDCPYPPVAIFETEDSEFAKDLKQGVLTYFAKTQK
jgi:hypothetical protein